MVPSAPLFAVEQPHLGDPDASFVRIDGYRVDTTGPVAAGFKLLDRPSRDGHHGPGDRTCCRGRSIGRSAGIHPFDAHTNAEEAALGAEGQRVPARRLLKLPPSGSCRLSLALPARSTTPVARFLTKTSITALVSRRATCFDADVNAAEQPSPERAQRAPPTAMQASFSETSATAARCRKRGAAQAGLAGEDGRSPYIRLAADGVASRTCCHGWPDGKLPHNDAPAAAGLPSR